MIYPPRHVYFKEGFEKILLSEYEQLKPQAQIILDDMGFYCYQNGRKFTITDIISNPDEDKRLGRVSASHSEGRAFDFRIHEWPKEFLDKFERWFENKYKKLAAVGKETGQRNLIVYHDNGNGQHGHCQIHKEFSS